MKLTVKYRKAAGQSGLETLLQWAWKRETYISFMSEKAMESAAVGEGCEVLSSGDSASQPMEDMLSGDRM